MAEIAGTAIGADELLRTADVIRTRFDLDLLVLTRGAAMRFLLTRLHDWFHTPEDALARRKDPLEFVPLIEFHRSVSDSTAYGLG